MRVKKQKRHRRVVRFYSACFGFREPFKVLCDGTFIHHLLLHRLLPAPDALSKLLGARVTLFSSRCISAELKTLGESHAGSLQASQQLNTASCDHEMRVNAAACIESIIREGNTEHYFVATQDGDLRRKLRELAGVPVIYGLKNSLFLEQPSVQQRDFAKISEEDRLHISESEIQILQKRGIKSRLPEQATTESAGGQDIVGNDVGVEQSTRLLSVRKRLALVGKSKFKRKKAMGPNPLSCKKKKIKESSANTDNQLVVRTRELTPIRPSTRLPKTPSSGGDFCVAMIRRRRQMDDGGRGDPKKRKRNRRRKRSQQGAVVKQEEG